MSASSQNFYAIEYNALMMDRDSMTRKINPHGQSMA